MESIDIIKKILPGKTPYKKTLYMLRSYKDMKRGRVINEEKRGMLDIIDTAVELIKDDTNIDIIYMMLDGKTVEKIAELKNMDTTTVYRRRRRLVKRLSIIIYGDVAL